MKRVPHLRRVLADLGYRFGGWPRRLVAAGCLALAALAAASEHRRRAPPPQLTVLVAARDLPAGRVLNGPDVRTTRWPTSAVPAAALHERRQVVGGVLAAAMTIGEPFTPARLYGRGLAAGLRPAQVAATVTLADPSGAQLLQAGDVVDLVVAPQSSVVDGTTATPARVLVSSVRLLAVLAPVSASGSGDVLGTARLVVVTDVAGSLRIAGAGPSPIVATLRAPP